MPQSKTLRIGTRGSPLALTQARMVALWLGDMEPGLNVEIVPIKTKGDKILDVPLAKVGGKGLFVKEIEDALLEARVDLAVHSMKDVPAQLPGGLGLTAICEREDVRDVLVCRNASGLDDLPQGATVGTSSLRRQAQLLHLRPDLEIVPLRGNLETRLRKLDELGLDAVVLAAAGIIRQNMTQRITEYQSDSVMLSAVGQGALGLETRVDDAETNTVVERLNHETTRIAVSAERAFLGRLEGGCQVPIACLGVVEGERLTLDGLVAGLDGSPYIRRQISGSIAEGEALGKKLAREILDSGGKQVLDELYDREAGS